MQPCGRSAVLRRLACSLIETDDPRGYYLAQRVAQFLEFARGTGWISAEMLRRRLVVRQLIRELEDPSNIVTDPPLDANTLDADLWHAPPDLTPKPVILIQTPYNKNRYRLGAVPGYASPSFPVSTNYHYVIVDWRGFYGSGAAAVPGYDRGLDGFDCVEWIARQPWSNARVGTWGGSALGFIQYHSGVAGSEFALRELPIWLSVPPHGAASDHTKHPDPRRQHAGKRGGMRHGKPILARNSAPRWPRGDRCVTGADRP